MKKIKLLTNIFIIIFCVIILALSLRGLPGNPQISALNTQTWKEDGPFELSPERGRFALMYSLVEEGSFQFSKEVAWFANPDVVVIGNQFASMFAPLLSFIIVPGYLIGKYFGLSQVGSFAVISFFAILNFFLIRSVSIKLGANSWAATIAAMVFLFATPAFTYAVDLYQHHISVFLIFISLYALLRFNNFWSLLIVFFACAVSVPLDYPNLFFMFPIGAFAMGRIVGLKYVKEKVTTTLNLPRLLTLLVMIIPILFFLWFNKMSYSNPFQLSGTLPSGSHLLQQERQLDPKDNIFQLNTSSKETIKEKTALGFFKSRRLLDGFYIQFLSPDRGLIFYTPVVLLGMIGFVLAYRKRNPLVPLLFAILGANILLYSMWGDPWGGWAFGSRYLIPTYALLSIFVALILTYWGKKVLFLSAFLIIFSYSVAVNTLGAITSSANPPQVEVLELEKLSGKVQKYTYERNWDFLITNNSKSFFYQAYAKNFLFAVSYYQIITVSIISLTVALLVIYQISLRRSDESR